LNTSLDIVTFCNYNYLMKKVKFVWDKEKSKLNLEKHGIAFSDAKCVFKNPTVTFEDDRFDYGEKRFITLGLLEKREIVIIHTPRGNLIRIISMRKANVKEKKIYKKRLKTTG